MNKFYKLNLKVISCLGIICATLFSSVANAQEENIQDYGQVVLDPLFEYIEAPDDLPDLQSRTDYLMDNFWNPFDFDASGAVDQYALNHAFSVYAQAMPYASEKKVTASVKKLINKIKDNPVLTFQFTKAAEENLYSPRALFWSDDIYICFLENIVSNKGIDDSRKSKYVSQLELLKKSAIGSKFPEFNVVNINGTETRITTGKKFTLIEITTPSNEDFRYANLKLDISGVVNDMISDGVLDVDLVFISDKLPQLNYPEKWNVFFAEDINKSLDVRINPSFYVLDANNEIIGKNLSVDDAIYLIESLNSVDKK